MHFFIFCIIVQLLLNHFFFFFSYLMKTIEREKRRERIKTQYVSMREFFFFLIQLYLLCSVLFSNNHVLQTQTHLQWAFRVH
ncbi:hypothetical protein MtrunA17_Chr5g0403111 [Medicago truncatula]|uniref:Transmembrane protein n=1 Tax=Medicago truncatula TaxID=3880 RepID=A0A396HNG8_MEDTR|nr:hypothetical protein MtrunA17_Chr5g0403111 [Medicago truncatula]